MWYVGQDDRETAVPVIDKTDPELVALARSGDKDAFGHLIERYQQMARRVAMGVVRHEDDARELAQEALLQAYLSLDRLRDDGRFESWLYGIVLNVCRSYLRDQKTNLLSLEALAGGLRFEAVSFTGVEPDPQEVAEAQELHRTVFNAVGGLSPKNRAATLLFYYEQLSVREIAATLGISVAAVKGRLHKSRGQLREHLLPLVSESSPFESPERRRRAMVKVTIADVMQTHGSLHMVALFDEPGGRVLPIYMREQEATSIAMGLREYQTPRPLTQSFMASVLEAVGGELEEVRVEELKGDTFYAVAKVRSGDRVREVDARPSDTIGLAVLTGSPIYVADEVMEKAGQDVSEELAGAKPRGKGIDDIVDVVSKTSVKSHHEMMGYLFGGDE